MLLAVVAPAHAEQALDSGAASAAPDAKVAAEAHFRAGLARAEAGDWRAALAEFDASYALLPSAAALSNKALSLQHLGQHAEALALCEQVLNDFARDLEPDERAQLERVRAELAERVGAAAEPESAPPAAVPKAAPAAAPGARRSEARPQRESRALSLEGAVSLLWASSFHASADASCGKSVVFADESAGRGCSRRSRPFGAAVSARVAYNWLSNFWLEAGLGYLSLSAHMRRSLEVAGENALFGSRDLEDRVTLSGGVLGLGLSYRVLPKTPLVARISTGLLLGRQTAHVSGSFTQTSNLDSGTPRAVGELDLVEDPTFVWAPLVSPELRAGIRVTPRLTLDLGVALLIVFVPHQTRTADVWQQREERRWPLSSDGANLGIVQLPNESALGTLVAVAPSVGARWDF